ncbi:hypothetical protein [Erythrobacter litoralis]|uniref:Uncharacterized protein n=1 Tax=Erythrobacter litoralis (strain HTCC2594) TaxID=314225 RepID=Q2ND98_ERYLH|nr:hypothetical protein [Erythrobacter litoralis]ABC62343.1 hypothetical protein ELI_01255 [Erythrobacter litoralis HTCC2594]
MGIINAIIAEIIKDEKEGATVTNVVKATRIDASDALYIIRSLLKDRIIKKVDGDRLVSTNPNVYRRALQINLDNGGSAFDWPERVADGSRADAKPREGVGKDE